MSCNREKHSVEPQDVLYNVKSSDHFINWAISAFKAGIINKFKYQCPLNNVYGLTVIHEPHCCMFPHCNVYIVENGIHIHGLEKPKLTKSIIKEYYSKHSVLVSNPKSSKDSFQ